MREKNKNNNKNIKNNNSKKKVHGINRSRRT